MRRAVNRETGDDPPADVASGQLPAPTPPSDAAARRAARAAGESAAASVRRAARELEESDQEPPGPVLERQPEPSARRFRFLFEAAATLHATLDYETTLLNIVRVAVPTFADCTALYVQEVDGRVRRLVSARGASGKGALARHWQRRYPAESDEGQAAAGLLQQERATVYADFGGDAPALLENAAASDLVREVRPVAALLVPLVEQGRTQGVILLLSADPARVYGPADRIVAEQLARVAATSLDQARLYRQAREAMMVRDELVTSVVHDLRNPLTSVKGDTQLLRRQILAGAALERSWLDERLRRVDGAVTRVVEIVNQGLALANLEGTLTLEDRRAPTDLVVLALGVAESYHERTVQHEIRVISPEEHLVGLWDATLLDRALDNLVGNAVKYSPNGGQILLEINREPHGREEWAVVRVRDQGIGIPRGEQKRIFERFRRGSNVVGRFGGSGIGLTNVRRIVEQHDGTVGVESAEGRGSTFTIRLPMTHASGRRARYAEVRPPGI